MKVDTIITGFGDIEVEYSTFTKGFFIKKYPEKLEQVKGLKLLKSRDSSFTEFKKLQDYVKDLWFVMKALKAKGIVARRTH